MRFSHPVPGIFVAAHQPVNVKNFSGNIPGLDGKLNAQLVFIYVAGLLIGFCLQNFTTGYRKNAGRSLT
jgi:hypothetical protein